MGEIKGYISQVIGPVVDIHFDNGKEEKITLPRIHDAMEITLSLIHISEPTRPY